MSTNYPLTLFYDAACPVCALEMDHLRDRDTERRLIFIDIGAPGFDPTAYGATMEQMDGQIHAMRPDGSMVFGVEALRLAYTAAGLGWVLRPTGWAPLKPLFDAGYRVFARHRRSISRAAAPLIAGVRAVRATRMATRMRECKNGGCGGPKSDTTARAQR
jgi:predicted DCC family thiol-disulfide oxidoreductase YuxK